jgi:hypothetical protein
MDGYTHVGVTSKSSAAIRSCCTLESEFVNHQDWIYGFFCSGKSEADLPLISGSKEHDDIQKNMEIILLASSYRINLNNLRALIDPLDCYNVFNLLFIYRKTFLDRDFSIAFFRAISGYVLALNPITRRVRSLVLHCTKKLVGHSLTRVILNSQSQEGLVKIIKKILSRESSRNRLHIFYNRIRSMLDG